MYDSPESDVRYLGPRTSHRALTGTVSPWNSHGATIEMLEQAGKVVDSLYDKVRAYSDTLCG